MVDRSRQRDRALPRRTTRHILVQCIFQTAGGEFPCQPSRRVLRIFPAEYCRRAWIPLSGVLIDRLGAKRVIIWMTLFYGLILITALWVGNSIWQLYLFFSILGIALSSGPVPVPYGAVISHWFNRHRGLALGLAMLGVLLMGEGYDRFHSYTVPLAGFCAVMLLALLLLSRLGPYRYGVTREASPPLEPVQVSSGA
jgi:OFA family oxalate/formate antiporter-like MFS transporter